MGQSQLLLIVLGVILVGTAIVGGIQAYDQNNRKGNVDALMQDAIRMASDLQIWAQKPTQFGGPATRGDFTLATHALLGYDADGTGGASVNSNGECLLAATTASNATVTCTNATLGTSVVVTVVGLGDDDITIGAPVLGN